jgi:hypothetical protein
MAYTIITNPITSITSTAAVSGGSNITLSGSGTVSYRGICWSTNPLPEITDSVYAIPGPSTANFTHTIPSLTPGTTYYVRAYVTDSISPTPNTYYGNQLSFITQNIVTTAASSITSTTAVSGGTFTGVTGNIISAGVCWDINPNTPDINDTKATSIVIGGSFTTNIMGLSPNTEYKIRCFIQTNVGVAYGDVKTFTTTSTKPTVTTNPTVSSIAATSFVAGGNVTASGGETVSARGIQRSLSPSMSSPTDVNNGTGTGVFTGTNITGLTAGTTYYFRAFATNLNGISYGQIYSTATLGGPTVVTIEPYTITNNSAITGCDVTSNGGASITARGVCYSNVETLPAVGNSTVINDPNYAQTEPFLTTLINLDNATTYYVRAFATNSVSTLYGETEIFRTTECNPFIENCNPVDPVVECSEPGCVYHIPSACSIYNGDSITCNNDQLFSSVPTNTVLVNNVQFIGSITTTVLTVTSMIEGTITNGTVIDAVGITANTSIVAQLTGVIGGIGTYTVNNSQTVTLRKFKNLRYSADVILNNINNSLCNIYDKQYITDMLLAIKNTYYLQDQFCGIICSNGEDCACTPPVE